MVIGQSGLTLVALEVVASPTTTWFKAIGGYYLLCAVAASCARPRWECERSARRHGRDGVAPCVRYAAWTVALAGPAVAELVPLTAGHPLATLFYTAVFAALAPLPSLRVQKWLRRRRPALNVALRSAPLVAVVAVEVALRPQAWPLLAIVGAMTAYCAAMRELGWSLYRGDLTRRRLDARARGGAVGSA